MKLNYKNTFIIGLAFFGILMLWQAYNFYCPLILEGLLASHVSEKSVNTITGIIMALDNIVAIFLMPIIGKLSDKTHTKWGKRMPYIVIGMMLTIIVFPLIAVMSYMNSLIGVIIFMLLFLVIMQAYRSPVVSLMPDITPKPLRSTANGIINLVGYFGAIFATVLGMIPFFKLDESSPMGEVSKVSMIVFLICTFVLIAILIILILKVKENKLLEENKEAIALGEKQAEINEAIKENNKLSKLDKRNLIILLVAIFLWFMSFNAFETFNSKFGKNILNDTGIVSTMTIILTVASILTFIFGSKLSNRHGRKKVVATGIILLVVALAAIGTVSLTVNFKVSDWRITEEQTIVSHDGEYTIALKNDKIQLISLSEVEKAKQVKITQIDTDAFEISEKHRYHLSVNDSYLQGKTSFNGIEVTEKTNDKTQYYQLFIDGDKVKIKNVKSGNYLNIGKIQEQLTLESTKGPASKWVLFFYAMALIIGIGWALININSFPMVVEYSDQEHIGKYTSYYYMASMLAQSITPILIGIIIDALHSIKYLFVYSAILMILALIVLLRVKESRKKIPTNDKIERITAQEALENLGDMD